MDMVYVTTVRLHMSCPDRERFEGSGNDKLPLVVQMRPAGSSGGVAFARTACAVSSSAFQGLPPTPAGVSFSASRVHNAS